MSLNAIPASPASFGVKSTTSSVSSTEELPLGFAELLANQVLLTPPVESQTNPKSLNIDFPDKNEQEEIVIAADTLQIDPLALAVAPPPQTNSISANDRSLKPTTGNSSEQALLHRSISSTDLVEEKTPGTNSADTSLGSAAFQSTFGEIGKQSSSKNSEAANIAELNNNPTQTATFEAALNKAAQTPANSVQNHFSVSPALTSHAWPKQFNEQIVWLAKNDQHSAQININPPQLGPVQITLNLSGDQMSAVFVSPHAEVRQAIESALPQLREMLSATGISLGDTNVGSNLARQNQETPFHSGNTTQSLGENAILPANDNTASTKPSQILLKGRGLVDLFA